MQFPDHPFWDYSLLLYARPGVADACLRLQDEFGLDVNLVLFCLWSGAEGPGRLAPSELRECVARGEAWQAEIVERLRYVRRTLKTDPLGADPELVRAFRPGVQSLELEAEHLEQLMLAAIVPERAARRGPAVASANLEAYLAHHGILMEDVREPVGRILSQAFPGEG